jgi:hypothetical protein
MKAVSEQRTIVAGSSQPERAKVSGRPFNLVVAFENSVDAHGNHCGRAIAESSFHHVVDYNWDI